VKSVRRIVVFVLLLALPFQAALGASGVVCDPISHHVHVASKADAHAGGHASDGRLHDGAAALHTHAAPVEQHDELQLMGSGGCIACSACCFAAAIVSPTAAVLASAPAALEISSNVDRTIDSGPLDELFCPPRTIES
jgi:hypothetical protein